MLCHYVKREQVKASYIWKYLDKVVFFFNESLKILKMEKALNVSVIRLI